MSQHDHGEEKDVQAEANASRRNFLKTAGAAGLTVGTTSLTGGAAGVAAIAALGASQDAEAAIETVNADPSRASLGGAPIADEAKAFGEDILPPLADRVLALKQLLIDKNIVTDMIIGVFVDYYNNVVGPFIGKAVVAHAWVDEAFRDALLNPQKPKYAPYKNHPSRGPLAASIYIREYLDQASQQGLLNFPWDPNTGPGSGMPGQGTFGSEPLGPEGVYIRVLANGYDKKARKNVHNMVCCTVCSCYPQALLGIQPTWYKSQQYRARAIASPRSVIREFAEANGNLDQVNNYLNGIDEIRVYDSNSEVRFFVIPEPPEGADLSPGNEINLVNYISRDGMLGTRIL